MGMWEKISKGSKKAAKPGKKPQTGKRTARPSDPTPLEADEQKMLFQWANYAKCNYPELALMYHIVNEGKRSYRAGGELVGQGMKRGVPDICLPVPKGRYGALYIELKRRSGGRVSEDQRAWIAALNRAGNRAVVCKGFDEAREEIMRYLGGQKSEHSADKKC